MRTTPRTSRAFTLVEVLIASTILFATITVISESYRASLMASEKATRTAQLLTPMPLIIGQIKNKLLQTPDERVQGRGSVLGVTFEFEARSTAFASPPARLDPGSGLEITYKPRFRLYDVKLTLRSGTVQRVFDYQEIAWAPVAI